MFSLISGFVEYMARVEELRLLILGLDGAGKTNVLEKLKSLFTDLPGMDPSKIMPTVGLNVGRMEAFGVSLIFWDLGGQPGLRGIWDKYYAEAHGLVYVVDASDAARLDEAKAALDKALGARELTGAPLLVLANKQVRRPRAGHAGRALRARACASCVHRAPRASTGRRRRRPTKRRGLLADATHACAHAAPAATRRVSPTRPAVRLPCRACQQAGRAGRRRPAGGRRGARAGQRRQPAVHRAAGVRGERRGAARGALLAGEIGRAHV